MRSEQRTPPARSTPPPAPFSAEMLAAEARRAFTAHLLARALAARRRYDGRIDHTTIPRLLDDRQIVRYPTTLDFDARPLHPGEFAFARPLGFHASDGYALAVHPWAQAHPRWLPHIVALHLPVISYGPIVTEDQALAWGSTLLGISPDTYYETLSAIADQVAACS